MDYNEFAEKVKAKYPEYKDVDNYDLATKVVAKYPEYQEKVTFEEQQEAKQGIDLTPSRAVKALPKAIATPFIAAKENVGLKDAYDIANERYKRIEKKHPVLANSVPVATDLYAYSQIPLLKGGGVGKFIGNAMLQGGIPGALEGLKQGNAGQGFGIGTGVGAGIQSLPYVGKIAKPLAKMIPATGSLLARTIGRVSPETLQRAVQADSKALDLTAKDAENLLMNTTERVRNQYNDILAKRGQDVGDAVKNLGELETPINANDLKQDINSIFDSYQVGDVNVAQEVTGDLKKDLTNLIDRYTRKPEEYLDLSSNNVGKEFLNDKKEEAYNILAQATGKNKQWLKSQLGAMSGKGVGKRQEFIQEFLENADDKLSGYPTNELNYYKPNDINDINTGNNLANRAYDDIMNNNFYQETLSGYERAIADTENSYKELLNGVIKTSDYDKAFADLSKITKDLPADIQDDYMAKLANDLSIIEKNNNTVTPESLEGIKRVLGDKTNWSDLAATKQNQILERVYGKYADRLSKLSPELQAANKAFADVAKFKKNEGLQQILKAGDRIDSASSKLKNYNNTVTKGNTGRNVQDLEDLIVSEGGAPFLKDIDDVNAAMDLLNIRTTGDSWLANLATQATRPALRAYRGLNRLAPKLQGLKGLTNNVGRLVTPATIQMLPLEGGVVYNENRY